MDEPRFSWNVQQGKHVSLGETIGAAGTAVAAGGAGISHLSLTAIGCHSLGIHTVIFDGAAATLGRGDGAAHGQAPRGGRTATAGARTCRRLPSRSSSRRAARRGRATSRRRWC